MSFYFVNCDDLEDAVMSRGIAGEWDGGDDYKEFTADGGAKLCCFVTTSTVLACGKNNKKLTAMLPELIPWQKAMTEVGRRIEELEAVKQENARLRARLCMF